MTQTAPSPTPTSTDTLSPTQSWDKVPEAIDALKTAFAKGDPMVVLLRALYHIVERATERAVPFVQLAKGGRTETLIEISQRLWHLGCALEIEGMGQARRDLTAAGLDPLTEEEHAERQRAHEARLAEEREARKALREEEKADRWPTPGMQVDGEHVRIGDFRSPAAYDTLLLLAATGNVRITDRSTGTKAEGTIRDWLKARTMVQPKAEEPTKSHRRKPRGKKRGGRKADPAGEAAAEMADALDKLIDAAEKAEVS